MKRRNRSWPIAGGGALAAAVAAMLVLAPEAAARGDVARGEAAFAKCRICHSADPGERGLPGPNLHGVIGRPAGSMPDFRYSEAMAEAGRDGLVWTDEALSAFMRDPEARVPGTAMRFLGIPRTRERLDILAYLRAVAE